MDRYQFPERVISIPISAATDDEGERLGSTLEQVCSSDPLLHFDIQSGPNTFRLHGHSEPQLDQAISALRSSLGLRFQVGSPCVGYLGIPSRCVDVDYTHKRQRGGRGEFARLLISVSPDSEGLTRMIITCGINDLPERFHAAIAAGFESVLQGGQDEACAYVGSQITVTGAAFHEKDSTPHVFELTARAALRDAFYGSKIRILEPYMKLEILAPEEFIGSVIGDMNSRRGLIISSTGAGKLSNLSAEVPVGSLFGFSGNLMILTRGQGSFSQTYGYHALRPTPGSDDDGPENFPPAIGMRA